MDSSGLGWNRYFADAFEPFASRGLAPGRVAAESRELYRLLTPAGEVLAEPTGALRYHAESREDLPAVGDWVAFQAFPEEGRGIVHALLPRRTRLARRAAGRRTEVQVVAANVDTVWIVTSLNRDLNPRRLERHLAVARDGGARPVVVLSKADLADDRRAAEGRLGGLVGGAPVHAVSAVSGLGLEALEPYLGRGQTVALLGSSGVGKSTLVNALAGAAVQAVREIRASDDRGRHATTARQLLPLPGGALLLDTPGLRELGTWDAEEALGETFAEIEDLGRDCRFRDCRHEGEPGCAVAEAVARGELDPGRLASYHKLLREETFLADRREKGASYAEKRRWKALSKRFKSPAPPARIR